MLSSIQIYFLMSAFRKYVINKLLCQSIKKKIYENTFSTSTSYLKTTFFFHNHL